MLDVLLNHYEAEWACNKLHSYINQELCFLFLSQCIYQVIFNLEHYFLFHHYSDWQFELAMNTALLCVKSSLLLTFKIIKNTISKNSSAQTVLFVQKQSLTLYELFLYFCIHMPFIPASNLTTAATLPWLWKLGCLRNINSLRCC